MKQALSAGRRRQRGSSNLACPAQDDDPGRGLQGARAGGRARRVGEARPGRCGAGSPRTHRGHRSAGRGCTWGSHRSLARRPPRGDLPCERGASCGSGSAVSWRAGVGGVERSAPARVTARAYTCRYALASAAAHRGGRPMPGAWNARPEGHQAGCPDHPVTRSGPALNRRTWASGLRPGCGRPGQPRSNRPAPVHPTGVLRRSVNPLPQPYRRRSKSGPDLQATLCTDTLWYQGAHGRVRPAEAPRRPLRTERPAARQVGRATEGRQGRRHPFGSAPPRPMAIRQADPDGMDLPGRGPGQQPGLQNWQTRGGGTGGSGSSGPPVPHRAAASGIDECSCGASAAARVRGRGG